MQTGKFIKNAAVLTVTALILRSIGMLFRIWLSNSIGADGMGLYQLIISVYMLAATFATSGICTAVTRLIAEELECGTQRSINRILRRSIYLTLIVALISTAAVWLLSDVIATGWIKDERASLSLKILSLSLPFMGVSSCIRGYFVACRRVSVQASAQIFEQLIRIALIMLIIGRFAPYGIGYACAAVLIGDTVAEGCSCLYMYIGYLTGKRRVKSAANGRKAPPYSVTGRIISISLPITAGRYLTTALRTVESLLVPSKLTEYSCSYNRSLSQFGQLKGMALPVLFFPGSFLSALSTLLVPEMSGAAALGDRSSIRSASRKTICITCEISMIIAGIFLVFSQEVGVAVYGSAEVGLFIRCLAPLVPLMYLESVTDGILKGLNQQNSLFRYNVVDSVVRIVLICAVVPAFGMAGFLTVMVVSNVLTATLCIGRLLRTAEIGFDLMAWALRPAFCTAAAAIVAWLALGSLSAASCVLRLILGAAVALGVYAVLMYCFGGFAEFTAVERRAKRRAQGEKRSVPAQDMTK